MEIIKVKDQEHWIQLNEISTSKLIVIDVHKGWCGPCKVIEPTYKRIFLEMDNAGKVLQFATYCTDLKISDFPNPSSCKPLFILYKDKKQIAQVSGANAPVLENLIKQNIPMTNSEEP